MRPNIKQGNWQQIRGKKRPHWSILTLDDLDKTNGKHNQLIIQLQARYKAAKEPGKDNSNQQKSEVFSI
jgi:uncharacterized protein YjbJ (UPF0337 family)